MFIKCAAYGDAQPDGEVAVAVFNGIDGLAWNSHRIGQILLGHVLVVKYMNQLFLKINEGQWLLGSALQRFNNPFI